MSSNARFGDYAQKSQTNMFCDTYAHDIPDTIEAAVCLWDAFIDEKSASKNMQAALDAIGTGEMRTLLTEKEVLNALIWTWSKLDAKDREVFPFFDFDFANEFLKAFFTFCENGVAKNHLFPANLDKTIDNKCREYWAKKK